MTAQIIDGKKLAQTIRSELKEKIALSPLKPSLAVIIVGNNPASEIYVKSKEKACLEVGITPQTIKLPETTSTQELLKLIENLNSDVNINGILVQLPLPKHIDTTTILQTIIPSKDVDGFHPINTGLLSQNHPNAFIPCTPKGIIRMLKETTPDLTGLNAVVVGRSQIVGIPIAQLLINNNCTVTITHSKTKNLPSICKTADILVVAIGKPEFITSEFIKDGGIIIDVGINRTQSGLKGDVKFDDAQKLASHITPVPGGVGPMTIAMLLENTYEAFLKQQHS